MDNSDMFKISEFVVVKKKKYEPVHSGYLEKNCNNVFPLLA